MSNSVVPPLPARETPRALAIEPAAVLVPLGLFVAIVAVAAPNGSYYPSSWGWAALAFLWAGAIGLIAGRRVSFGRLEVAYLGSWLALLAWTAASLLWSSTTTQTMYEVERTIVYVSFAFALAVLGRRGLPFLLPALLAAIVSVAAYALATRLLPDRVGSFDSYVTYRLSEPLGYWNALSVFVAAGSVLAVGLAARARNVVVRALSAASLVLLIPVLYFTFGRGGWLALAAGLAVAIVVDPRRLQLVTTLLLVAPWPAFAVWQAYESPSLTTEFSALADASEEGSRLALTIAVLAVVAAAVTVTFALVSDRVSVGRGVRLAYGAVLTLALITCVASLITAYGGPAESYRRAVDSIKQSSPNVRGDQTRRLFSLSGNGRLETWESTLRDARAHPALGSGAGTFERWWLEHREVPLKVRDAHGLYFETLAELGPFGLVALLGIVVVPLAAAVRARRSPLVAPALGGFTAIAVHAAVDWDWEMPAVIIVGLTCAGVLLLAPGAMGIRRWTLGAGPRAALLALIAVLSVVSFVTLTSNRYLGQASAALDRSDTAEAAADARRAERWAPWSTDALERQADAALADGSFERARRLYRAALAKDDGDWELWLGLALSSEGEAQRRALERARSLNPLAGAIEQLREQLGVRNSPP
ncbi:MAG TPA: O-antigen ligase family protein [Gaiellaceae bacterium]|nr:O-antigen ligase family protein [Gaiellaceae bacterium]